MTAKGAEPQPPTRLLGPTGADETALLSIRQPCQRTRRKISLLQLRQVFLDPGIRLDRWLYLRIVRLLVCGVLSSWCDVGIFTVPKKAGKQQLVVDARRDSLHFRTSESVALPTDASFTNLEIQLGDTPHCMQFDLADAFKQMELPVALRRFFSLSTVEKRELGIPSVEKVLVDDTTPIFPKFSVLLMAWTHRASVSCAQG